MLQWMPSNDFAGEPRSACWTFVAAALIGLGVSFGLGTKAKAEVFVTGGLSFSDELGGFRLLSATGRGTISDPIVLVEEITSLRPAILAVRQADSERSGTPHNRVLLRSLIKIVINKSIWRWSGFDLELRSEWGQASVYSDGLSFDQLQAIPTPLYSDLFAAIQTEDEPHDRVRYDQGRVEPDQTVHLAFNLIDLNPRALFYLAQEPIVLLADRQGLTDKHQRYAGLANRPERARTRSFNLPISP